MQKPRKFFHSPIYVDRHQERMDEMSQWHKDRPRHTVGWWQVWNLLSIFLLLLLIFIVWKFLL